jgi:hypothetical protein
LEFKAGGVLGSAGRAPLIAAALTDVCRFQTPSERLRSLNRLVWILPFQQISGKGLFLTPAHAGYRRKKSTAIARQCLIFNYRILLQVFVN